jgi:hypothetical protein
MSAHDACLFQQAFSSGMSLYPCEAPTHFSVLMRCMLPLALLDSSTDTPPTSRVDVLPVYSLFLQLFGSLKTFLAAAGLLREFEVISVASNRRQELVLKQQQQAAGQLANITGPQQQRQQQQQLWQQWDGMVPAHGQQQLADQQWSMQQQQQVMYGDSLWQQGAAAAAASYDDCDVTDDADDDIDDEVPLMLEAAQALQKRGAINYAVPLRATMESTAAAGGSNTSLFARVGGSGAAAVAFLGRWPYVFDVHQGGLDHPGPGGVRSGFQVQLQPGALQWQLLTQRFRWRLAGYRAALLAAVRRVAAEAQPGERRGVEVGKVGNRKPFGFMTLEVLPYRQVRGSDIHFQQQMYMLDFCLNRSNRSRSSVTGKWTHQQGCCALLWCCQGLFDSASCLIPLCCSSAIKQLTCLTLSTLLLPLLLLLLLLLLLG